MHVTTCCQAIDCFISYRVIEKTVYSEPLEGEAVQGSLVYEEIGDVRDTFNYTKNLLYGTKLKGTTSKLTSGPQMNSIPTSGLQMTSISTSDPRMTSRRLPTSGPELEMTSVSTSKPEITPNTTSEMNQELRVYELVN